MPIIVEIPGQGEVEFPDDMTDAQIEAAIQAQEPTTNTLKRQGGLTARAIGNVLTSPIQLGGNLLNKTLNKGNELLGGDPNYWGMPSDVIQRGLDKVTPKPANAVENITQEIAKSAPAMLIPAALGPQIAGGAAVNYSLSQPKDEMSNTMTGAAMPVALRGLGAAGEGLYDIGSRFAKGPKGQVVSYLDDVFKGSHKDVAATLDDLKPFVRGEQPTAGLGAVSGQNRYPQLKALEQEARTGNTAAARFADIDATNAAARVRALRPMTAPGARVPAAQGQRVNPSVGEAARSKATAPWYDQAMPERVPLTDELKAILRGPEASQAIAGGDKAFRQEVQNALGAGDVPPVGTIVPEPSLILDKFGKPFKSDIPPSVSIEQLQKISQQLKKDIDAIGGPDPTGRKARLIESRTLLEGMMESASPTYGRARSTYRKMSEPINQAAVGKELTKALRNPSGVERPGTFLNAVENAPQTIKKAGAPRYQELGQIMTPDQMAVINALKGSAGREQAYNALEASGRMTPKTNSPADVVESYLPPIFNQSMTTFKKALRKVGGYSDQEAQALLDSAMTDPRAMSQLLKMIPNQTKQRLQLLPPSSAMLAATLRNKEENE